MRMFNADGSESEMCGNGIRCVAKYVHDHGIAPRDRVTIETGRGVLTLDLEVEGGKARRIRVDMGPPILRAAEIPTTLPGDPPVNAPLHLLGYDLHLTAASMGNPHVVLYVQEVGNVSGGDDRARPGAPPGLPPARERPLRRGPGAGRGPDADLGARLGRDARLRHRRLRRLRRRGPDRRGPAAACWPTCPAATWSWNGPPTTAPSS